MTIVNRSQPRQQHTPRIAVIDNDSGFLRVLANRLDRLGWEHRTLTTPVPAADLVAMRLSALVVDITVLGGAAPAYLQRIGGEIPGLAIVICTGRSSVAQRVRGLRDGADDWLTKPCHPEELIARIEAIIRRTGRSDVPVSERSAQIGELEVNSDLFAVFVDGASVDLTRREFELIELLVSCDGRVLEREQIYQRVWGYTMAHGDRSVDVFVRKLRQKLERVSPGWRYIHTHFGVGYRFAAEQIGGQRPESTSAAATDVEAEQRLEDVAIEA